MADPVNFEGVSLANASLMTGLLALLLARGTLARADLAVIMDQSLLQMEELAARSHAASAAHTHLRLMQTRLLGPAGPPASAA